MATVKQATTLLQLARTDKENVRRKDLLTITPDLLVVETGFNVRGLGLSESEYLQQTHIQQHIEGLALAYERGDHVPPIVVKFDPKQQKAVIVDGWHRYKAIKLCLERGVPLQYISVTEMKGDESKRQLLMLQSSQSLQLTLVERAEIYNRLASYGFTPQEIADQVGKTVAHVYQMAKVYELPIETKRLIQQGKMTVNAALTPDEDKEKAVKRKVHRKAANKIVDQLLASENVEIENGMAKVSIPLELWEAFKQSQLKTEEDKKIEEAVKEFKKNQCSLPLEDAA